MRRLLIWLSPRELYTIEKACLLVTSLTLMVASFQVDGAEWRPVLGSLSNVISLYFMASLIVSHRILMSVVRQVALQDIEATRAFCAFQEAARLGDMDAALAAKAKFDEVAVELDRLNAYLKKMP